MGPPGPLATTGSPSVIVFFGAETRALAVRAVLRVTTGFRAVLTFFNAMAGFFRGVFRTDGAVFVLAAGFRTDLTGFFAAAFFIGAFLAFTIFFTALGVFAFFAREGFFTGNFFFAAFFTEAALVFTPLTGAFLDFAGF